MSEITKKLESGEIEIPRFQRSVVWPSGKKKSLISSIQKGYPIGAILVWERVSAESREWVVIDGLQRTSALREFSQEPFSYIDVATAVDDACIRDLFIDSRAFPSGWESNCRQSIEDFLRECKVASATSGYKPQNLYQAVLAGLEGHEGADLQLREEAVDILFEALRDVQSNVETYMVPVIVFDGPEGDLPDVFELINTGGTHLSKYEIYGAQWYDTRVGGVTQDVLDVIRKKYDDLLERGFEVADLPKTGEDFEPNLFEALFGISKIWSHDFPLLFESKDDPTHIEELAFSLIPLVLNVSLSKVGTGLLKKLPQDTKGVYQLAGLIDGLTDAIRTVDRIMAPYLGIKLNKKTKSADSCLSEWQVISMIARTYVGRYSIVDGVISEREGWKEDREKLEKELPAHVVSDVATGRWAGPLLQIARDRVWAESVPGEGPSPASHYTQSIEREQLERELTSMFERDRANRKSRQRAHVKSDDKTLLRFLYSNVVTVAAEHGVEEIDHVYPVSRLVSLIQAQSSDEGWPISHIANLALFPKPTNREKSSMTLAEYVASSDGEARLAEIQARVFMDPSVLDIAGAEWGMEEFHTFLKQRSAILVEALCNRVCS